MNAVKVWEEPPVPMVAVWYVAESGEGPICRACAKDARAVGIVLASGRIPSGRSDCEYCIRRI